MGKKLFSCRHPSSLAIKVKTESQPGICQCLLGPKGRFLCPISPKTISTKDKKRKNRRAKKKKGGKKNCNDCTILATFLAENKSALWKRSI